MGLFNRSRSNESKKGLQASAPVECPHTILVPRWDRFEDMGDENKAIEFVCESCGDHFTAEFARNRSPARIA